MFVSHFGSSCAWPRDLNCSIEVLFLRDGKVIQTNRMGVDCIHCASCPRMRKKLAELARANGAMRHACTMTMFSPYDFFALEMPRKQQQKNWADKQAALRNRPTSNHSSRSDLCNSSPTKPPEGFLARKMQMTALSIESEVWHAARSEANQHRARAMEFRERTQRQRRRLQSAPASLTSNLDELDEPTPRMYPSAKIPSRQLPPALQALQHFQVLPEVRRRGQPPRMLTDGSNLGRPSTHEPYICRCYTPPTSWFKNVD